ncbi:hypothetical protein ASG43_03350 [Aureimonas sp. Leaf454]|uniref:hypothetical protein n=1 Tax=Aureimonas sp. Leaf454 TaxID=1736381 RepID=UPI0006F805F5|nr:hypothetical protein [Aureimonas sp. Leaf454]KQT54636.1 hypothetical protein ASG43_03350 [Aureimonas sp. Leaf454]
MAKVLFASATLVQLISFATTNLGLEVDTTPMPSKAAVRALITSTGFDGDEIEVADELVGSTKKPIAAEDVAGRKMIRIMIPVQEGVAGGTEAVPVGVNGTVARIMRGVDVDVPAEYVEVLKNANKEIFERGPNGELTNPKLVPIYPFSIIGIVA